MTTTNDNNSPVKQIRSINGISASIWKRESKEGEVYYTASIDRSYKDKDNKWHRTNNFRLDELPIVRKLAEKAEAFINDLLLETEATV
jgi:hypothetical protein